ncbi:hypothetical protein GCM10010455_18020 [Microbacterium esteraromaticum]
MAGGDRVIVRWKRLWLALVLANFGTGACFVLLYAGYPFELWGRLQFFEDPAWPVELVAGMLVGGLIAIPLPTALSASAVSKLKGVLPWPASVAVGPIFSSLLIPVYVWSSPSNVIMLVAILVIGVAANIGMVRALHAVAVSDARHVRS